MTLVRTQFARALLFALAGMAALGISGCGSLAPSGGSPNDVPPQERNVLRVDDEIGVSFSGIPNPPDGYRGRIKEDETISLPYVGAVKAAGKSTGELEMEIKALYVPKYYKELNVTVNSENRWFYVDGYVKNPNRHIYAGEMTLTRAIAAAGGCNEFANRSSVKLTRSNGQVLTVNYDKALRNSKLDVPIYAGDRVYVPRSLF